MFLTHTHNHLYIKGMRTPHVKPEDRVLDLEEDRERETGITALTDPVVPTLYNVVPRSEVLEVMQQQMNALENISCDGTGLTPSFQQLQAYPNIYTHATEREMQDTGAVPLTFADLKAKSEALKARENPKFMRDLFKANVASLGDMAGVRVRVAYRLTRQMAAIRGIGEVGTPLIMTFNSEPGIDLMALPLPYDPTMGIHRGVEAIRNYLAIAQQSTDTYSYFIQDKVYEGVCMSILPPPISDHYFPHDKHPSIYRALQWMPPAYTPREDLGLEIYLNIMELLIDRLSIGAEQPAEVAVTKALLNPDIARMAWPTSSEILAYEEGLLLPWVSTLSETLADSTVAYQLKKDLGMTTFEALDLLQCSKTYQQHIHTYDPARERSVVLNKLNKLTESSIADCMPTTTLNSIKTSLIALGLTRNNDDEIMDDRKGLLSSALEQDMIQNGEEEGVQEDLEIPPIRAY